MDESSAATTLKEEEKNQLICEISKHIISDPGNQISINYEQFMDMSQKFGTDNVIDAISDMIHEEKIEFPYKKYFMGDIDEKFTRLKNYKAIVDYNKYALPNINFKTRHYQFPILFHDSYTTVVSQGKDWAIMDDISDYFQERVRMLAKRSDTKYSPMDFWKFKECNKKLIKSVISQKQNLDAHNLREALYMLCKECTTFKPSLTKYIIELIGATRVLDFSAGWGDRLLGAIASNVKYYFAADPNILLKEGHDAIINKFAENKERFKIVYEPFQNVEIPQDTMFDLVFTSPPFFDFETYTTDIKGQSVDDYPLRDEWLVNFLFVSLHKSWEHLEKGGHMAIHITDVYKTKICEIMNLFIQYKLPGAKYCGVISSRGPAEKPRPIWIWKKESTTDRDKVKSAYFSASKFYTKVFELIEKRFPSPTSNYSNPECYHKKRSRHDYYYNQSIKKQRRD